MTKPAISQEAMLAVVGEHMEAEGRNDVQTTLETMSADPFWEQCTIGVRVQGREAIGTWYTSVLPGVMLRATAVRDVRLTFDDTHVVAEHEMDVTFPDGVHRLCRHIAYYFFDGDGKIAGERAYCDLELGRLWLDSLPEGFFELPGVTHY
jgi:hypothetical protein